MGIVYRCKDLRLDRDVAVKVIGWSLSDTQVVRFHQEARALAKLQHPNILAIENFAHSDDGSLFLVMELLKGKRLSDIIESETDIPFDQALQVFIQICNGLSHAHNRDILHRDIKPSNIFLDYTKYDTAHVTITDFGLAKLVTEDQRLTKTGISIGSPPYMSPEQANGSTVDERSDLYAVGCLMYEVLSGEKPFSGSSIPHILMKHAKEPPPRLSEQVPERSFPSEIDTIISTCLAKSPSERFQSVSELREALQKLLNRSPRRYADGTGFSGSYSQQTLMEKSNLSGSDQSQRHSKLGLHVMLSLLVLGILTSAGAGWLIFADRSNESDLTPEEPYLTVSTGDEDIPPPEETKKAESKRETPLVVSNRRDARKQLEELIARYRDGAAFPSISLARSDVRDKDLELLEGLPIKKLNLFRTAITDSGLEHLSKLPQLEELDLGITKITDEGVKLLKQFPSLKTIRLTRTAITDAGVSELSRCPNLTWIGLVNCDGVTGTTLGDLKRLKRLYMLNLARSGFQGKNIKEFNDLKVYYIDLSGIQLDDSEIATLSEVTRGRTQMLAINNNRKVTAEGFVELGTNTNLMMISIIGCAHIKPTDYPRFIQAHRLPIKIVDTRAAMRGNIKRARLAREVAEPLEEWGEEE